MGSTFTGTTVVNNHILTVEQAANALRVETTDLRMLDLLSQVDKFVERATGRDWTQDTAKSPIAISAATMLIVMWFDNPSMIGQDGSLPFGLNATLAQLEVDALRYRKYQVTGVGGSGYIRLPGAQVGDQVIRLSGVYGSSGDQSAKFESTVQYQNSLKQIVAEDLGSNIYIVILKSPGEDIVP